MLKISKYKYSNKGKHWQIRVSKDIITPLYIITGT